MPFIIVVSFVIIVYFVLNLIIPIYLILSSQLDIVFSDQIFQFLMLNLYTLANLF